MESDLVRALARTTEGSASSRAEDLDRYAAAACHYALRPLAVVWPRHAGDVEAIVAICRARGVPLTARGAGSGVAGQSVGRGVVADFSRHMTRILAVDREARIARVQPGLALGALNAALAPTGLHFAPDPSSGAYCTVGGMIANNAGGPHSVAFGSTRDHVVALQAVTGEGNALRAGAVSREALPSAAGENGRLARALAGLGGTHAGTIAAHSMRTARNASGYDLAGALRGEGVNPARLLTGSEGTLAVVTEATLRLTPLPAARATALAFFASLERAGEGVLEALAERPSCAELVSETLLRMLRQDSPALASAVPPEARALLLLEFDAGSEGEASRGLERIRARFARRGLALDFSAVTGAGPRAEIWAMRAAATLTLTAREGTRRNMRFIEDACVPPQRLVEFIEGVGALTEREGIETAVFGHAADSLIHVNPLMDPADPGLFERVEAMASEFADLVIRCGGTLSGEHGDGRLRTPLLPRRFGPLYPVFGAVKALFDPEGILNPGIIVGAPGQRITDGMRREATPWSPSPPEPAALPPEAP